MWIRFMNDGEVSLYKAINMLGASVKDNPNAIGMFGSGLKYALAQAVRQNVKIKFADVDGISSLASCVETLKDRPFTKVCFKAGNKLKQTALTSEFGSQEWLEPWFIYRELYCNALDEPGAEVDVVKKVTQVPGKTCVYLEYNKFKDIYENHSNYFLGEDETEDFVRVGTGRVYKQRVYIGNINMIDGGFCNFKLDWQCNCDLTESRVMKPYSTFSKLEYLLQKTADVDVLAVLLRSNDRAKEYLDINFTEQLEPLHAAFLAVYGDYAICPDAHAIKEDIKIAGKTPVVPPSSWILPKGLPSYEDFLDASKLDLRKPTQEEVEKIEAALGNCRAFGFGEKEDMLIKIFEPHHKDKGDINGEYVIETDEILLNSNIFSSRFQTMRTLLEEIVHRESGYSDYSRGFANDLMEAITRFSL